MKQLLFIPMTLISINAFAFGVDIYQTEKDDKYLSDAASSYGWSSESKLSPDEFIEIVIIDDLKSRAINYRLREDVRAIEALNRNTLESSIVVENWDETKE